MCQPAWRNNKYLKAFSTTTRLFLVPVIVGTNSSGLDRARSLPRPATAPNTKELRSDSI